MGDTTETTMKLLKQAIRSEIDGRRFYEFLASKTKNPDAKRKLTTLASDEKRHESLLYRIYEKKFGKKVDEVPEEGVGVLSKFFANPEKYEGLGEVQYIDMAIEAELAATEYYKSEANNAPDEETKQIFVRMSEEEYSHFESLEAEKSAIGGNYYWFEFDETRPMEG